MELPLAAVTRSNSFLYAKMYDYHHRCGRTLSLAVIVPLWRCPNALLTRCNELLFIAVLCQILGPAKEHIIFLYVMTWKTLSFGVVVLV